MAKIDKAKEQISFLKFWLSLVMASILAVIGFCVSSYAKIALWFLGLCFLCVVCLCVCAWLLSKNIVYKIHDLKEM